MTDFANSADSRETSQEIIDAIVRLSQNEKEAIRIWESPTYEESLAIWERVTDNGLRDSNEYCWGASGSNWAGAAGLEG